MDSVTAPEESPVECTCEPFTIVRYRDQLQEPSFVDGVVEGEIAEGALVLTDAAGKFLFAAPLDAILSAEKVA
jgi:hypothetical protein